MKSYWKFYKEKTELPDNAFNEWIRDGISDNALKWIKQFAKYLTLKGKDIKILPESYQNELHATKNQVINILKSDGNKLEKDFRIKQILENCYGANMFDTRILDYFCDINFGKKSARIYFRETVTTSKLRKFFGAVKKIQNQLHKKAEDNYRQFQLLLPKLAYDVGREKDPHHKLVDFYYAVEELTEAIKNAVKEDGENGYDNFKKVYFPNFVDFFESLVAYFKAYENNVFENA